MQEIWHKYNSGKMSAKELGKEYDFTEGMILKAIRLSGNEARKPWDTNLPLILKRKRNNKTI